MKVVDIFRRRPEDGSIERLIRVHAATPGEPASYEVLLPEMKQGLDWLIAEGAYDQQGNWLQLADGERFVEALPHHYHGSRFWAEEVDTAADPAAPE